MLPVIALVGRPNVGKSTLFNRLTRSRDAIVDDQPGITRDRMYGRGQQNGSAFLVVDTGGLEAAEESQFARLIHQQVEWVIDEAQHVFFVVDARDGLVPADSEIADQLRRSRRPITVVVNKAEGVDGELAAAEFQELALGVPWPISARQGDGVAAMLAAVLAEYAAEEPGPAESDIPLLTLAGRPNVGKSTLANKLVGEHRMLVSDLPGTTRDSVRIPLSVAGKEYVLIDTAGVRRKARVQQAVEKFSVIKTLQAVANSHVVLLVLDASGEIGAQDATIAGMVQELGKSMVVVINKWDRLDSRQKQKIKHELASRLPFLAEPEVVYISALHGSNLDCVIPAGQRAYDSAMRSMSTAGLNRTLQAAVARLAPPVFRERQIRLKFAHQAGKNPPVIIVHGSQAEQLPESYRRYLCRFFRRYYALAGTPLRIIPRNSHNPFATKRRGGKPAGLRRQPSAADKSRRVAAKR